MARWFSRRKRWLLAFSIPTLMLVVSLGGIPWLLRSTAAREALLGRANGVLAPARLSIADWSFSWFAPTRLFGVSLHDRDGRLMVDTQEVRWDRSLLQILWNRSVLGTMDLGPALLEVQRSEDGTINLLEALRPLLIPNPSTDLTLQVRNGSLVVKAVGLPRSFQSDRTDLDLRIPPAPQAVAWNLDLSSPSSPSTTDGLGDSSSDSDPPGRGRIKISGQYDRWKNLEASRLPLDVSIQSERWPIEERIEQGPVRCYLTGTLDASRQDQVWNLKGTLNAKELETPDLFVHPESLDLNLEANYLAAEDQIDLKHVVLKGLPIEVDGSGRISELSSRRLAEITTQFIPDWETINARLPDKNAKVWGDRVRLQFRASLNEDFWTTVKADLASDPVGADWLGMRMEPTPLSLHWADGGLTIDPIITTLNKGKLVLRPRIETLANGETQVRLGSDSHLDGAEVNDQVASQVLAYVAPVLRDATRVLGRVSVDLEDATIPIQSETSRKLSVQGKVVFDDVIFSPGPLAGQLLALVGRPDIAAMRLDDPIVLTIGDGRIDLRGLNLPIAGVTQLEIAGMVDFEKNLALTASVPVTSRMLGQIQVLESIFEGLRVTVPIGGTLGQPKVDGMVFKQKLGEMGKELATRSAITGVSELFKLIGRPRERRMPDPRP